MSVPTLRAALVAARPKQWLKNGLVVTAPAAAGVLPESGTVGRLVVAFVAFSAVASATYLFNDINDRSADRLHERKRTRPVASGAVSVAAAAVLSAVLAAAGLALGSVLGGRFVLVLAIYGAVAALYSAGLKRLPVIEIACVAAGFVLRALAGAAASDVEPSRWFLIVAGAGSVFMVAGKRHSEILATDAARARAVLAAYTTDYLRFVWRTAAALALTAYALWAFEEGSLRLHPAWAQLSLVPFSLGFLRYGLVIEDGRAGAPEDVVLTDRVLVGVGLVWAATFAAGLALGRP